MYPAHYFSLFPPFPRDDSVFVAMPFALRFKQRWEKVIRPAIEEKEVAGLRLKAHCVNQKTIADSIATEILEGIAKCRLFLADVSALLEVDGLVVRNANVLYEVGLAHATRLPEEVILFRDDEKPLLFDISNIRVNSYSPDTHPEKAVEQIRHALDNAFKEIELTKHLTIRKLSEMLDVDCWRMLIAFQHHIKIPIPRNLAESAWTGRMISAMHRLLELGLITMKPLPITAGSLMGLQEDEQAEYFITPMGETTLQFLEKQSNSKLSEQLGRCLAEMKRNSV